MTDHGYVCKDPECYAHGRYLRRIGRLVRALVAERAQLDLTERALEVNSDEVIRLRKRLEDPMAIPVLDVRDPDQAGAGARYAAEVQEWQWWRTKGAGRDERAMGWDRAHTTLCGKIPCREHRNPFQRSRA